jgi:glycine/D-amino acid oxidase-like deaminating enzyme
MSPSDAGTRQETFVVKSPRFVMNDTENHPGENGATTRARPRLNFGIDVDVCVVGAGLAGLTAALECARKGASVALLEARQVGWGASGCNVGSVLPGYGVPVNELIARVGLSDTRDLWALAQLGADFIRATAIQPVTSENPAAERTMAALDVTGGALEVSNVDQSEAMMEELQILCRELGSDAVGWQTEQVRDALKTKNYFQAVHYPSAFQLDGSRYLHKLAAMAENAGVRIFEDSAVVAIDPVGIRKRVSTLAARVRCSDMVLAGNVHIGEPATRLAATLVPIWRYAALSAPLGERLREAVAFPGSVVDRNAIDHYRVVDGDRLLWSSFETTWEARPERIAKAIQRRIASIFPQLGDVPIVDCRGAVFGQTIHGMPQIGRLRPGVWVASGFGRQGLNTSGTAGVLIAQSMLWGDDRWKLFSPFELVWAGASVGRVVTQVARTVSRSRSTAVGALARYRERAKLAELANKRIHEERILAAKARMAQSSQAGQRQETVDRLPDSEPSLPNSQDRETRIDERA